MYSFALAVHCVPSIPPFVSGALNVKTVLRSDMLRLLQACICYFARGTEHLTCSVSAILHAGRYSGNQYSGSNVSRSAFSRICNQEHTVTPSMLFQHGTSDVVSIKCFIATRQVRILRPVKEILELLLLLDTGCLLAFPEA